MSGTHAQPMGVQPAAPAELAGGGAGNVVSLGDPATEGRRIFRLQRAAFMRAGSPGYPERRSALTRLERLKRSVVGLPPPGQFELVVAVPVGCGMVDDLPPGVHFNADGRVATVVYEGAGPDPAVMAGLQVRLVPSGLAITSAPILRHVPTPIDDPDPRRVP